MLLLYLRLHFIIHRAHDNFVSFNDEEEYGAGSGSGSHTASKSGGTWSSQPIHLSKLSDGSSQERIVSPPPPPPTPALPPRPKTRKSRGAADLRRVSYS